MRDERRQGDGDTGDAETGGQGDAETRRHGDTVNEASDILNNEQLQTKESSSVPASPRFRVSASPCLSSSLILINKWQRYQL